MASDAEHVVLGTGPLGRSVVRALRHRGESVRAVDRSGDANLAEDVDSSILCKDVEQLVSEIDRSAYPGERANLTLALLRIAREYPDAVAPNEHTIRSYTGSGNADFDERIEKILSEIST